MNANRHAIWTRREALRRLSAASCAGLFGLGARPAVAAEPPPETRAIRLIFDPEIPVLCYAPQYLVEDFLYLEGFTDVSYVGYGDAISDYQVIGPGKADISAGLASDHIVGIDAGAPIVVLGGLHAGCVEVFGNERVRSIRDLGGKRVAIYGLGGPEHVFLSSVIAYIGLDPARDIEWVEATYSDWPRLLEEGKVDVVSAFPPQNLVIREKKIAHVILNTTIDDPWRHYFCCMLAARRDFVRDNPIATKRVLRAFVKATQLCSQEPERAARLLVERGASRNYEHAVQTLREVPYGAWRTYDPEDTLRFFSLRLRQAGLIGATPNEIIARGADFQFQKALRRELKA